MTNTVEKILCDDCGTLYAVSETHCPECGMKRPHLTASDGGNNVGVTREYGVATPPSPNVERREPRASSKVPAVAALLMLGLLVLGVGGWYWYDSTPEGMVYVKGGKYTMGRNDGDEFERPAHEVSVSPFYIDKTEVTCEQYEKFVEAEGYRPPPTWGGPKCPAGAAKLPVTGVNWDDASAYARWNEKRLPTEEEWEFVARGEEGRLYPWGDKWQAGMANALGNPSGGPVEVGKYNGVSPLGVYDLIGNAWEWTASDLEAYPGGQLPAVVPKGELKVIRGGSWREGEYATGSYRAYLKPRDDADYSATGFRCARDAGR